MKPRVLVYDIESSFNLGYFFELKVDGYLNHQNIVEERHIFCIAYKWVGEKGVHLISIPDDPKRFKKNIHDDSYVLEEFVKVFEQADIVVHQNGDSFDIKMINSRLIRHGMNVLPKTRSIDTYKLAKASFRFNSNRLDYLAQYLGYEGKMANPTNLWIKAYQGDIQALQHMGKYCKQDVKITEFVYHKLIPSMKTNIPRVQGVSLSKQPQCQSIDCLSFNTIWRGTQMRFINKKLMYRYSCNDCGKMNQTDTKE